MFAWLFLKGSGIPDQVWHQMIQNGTNALRKGYFWSGTGTPWFGTISKTHFVQELDDAILQEQIGQAGVQYHQLKDCSTTTIQGVSLGGRSESAHQRAGLSVAIKPTKRKPQQQKETQTKKKKDRGKTSQEKQEN